MKNIHKIDDNIYITSNEEIKEGDWYLVSGGVGLKMGVYKSDGNTAINDWNKKIVLTIDQNLIKDGVQSINDDFLQWFVKNPSCEEVEVEIEPMFPMYSTFIQSIDNPPFYGNLKRKIIIPKEEHPKQDYSGVHLRHCYQGEYEDGCKYGEDDCPAKPLEPKQETLEELKTNLDRLPFSELVKEFAKYYEKVPIIEATSSQTTSDKWKEYQEWLNEVPEISDEEIKKQANIHGYEEHSFFTAATSNQKRLSWIAACKWYREQLKTK